MIAFPPSARHLLAISSISLLAISSPSPRRPLRLYRLILCPHPDASTPPHLHFTASPPRRLAASPPHRPATYHLFASPNLATSNPALAHPRTLVPRLHPRPSCTEPGPPFPVCACPAALAPPAASAPRDLRRPHLLRRQHPSACGARTSCGVCTCTPTNACGALAPPAAPAQPCLRRSHPLRRLHNHTCGVRTPCGACTKVLRGASRAAALCRPSSCSQGIQLSHTCPTDEGESAL